MNWVIISFQWYFTLFILGLIFLPLTFFIFSKFFWEQGYAFSKVIGIIILSYSIFSLGFFKILPFYKSSLILLLFVFLIINLFILKKIKNNLKKTLKKTYKIWLLEEGLFLIAFFIWTYIRGQEPSIRSLEKFMDFGFINSILKTEFFPPLDMWLSGEFINYYYFGHLTGATLIKLSGILPSIGYNLILSTLFALGTTLTFSLSSNLVFFLMKTLKRKISYKNLIIFGLFSAFMLNLGGNLHTIYIFTKGYKNDNPIPFWQKPTAYSLKELITLLKENSFNPISTAFKIIKNSNYWYPNATRFIPFTIHEFPSYSYVVADLHGHLLNIPYVLLTIAAIFILFTNIDLFKKHSVLLPMTLGFLISILYMTNAFDGPIYFLLTLILLILSKTNIKEKLTVFTFITSGFFIFALPFSANFKPFVSGIGVNCSPDFLTNIGKIGPFLFEKGNCQVSPIWMLVLLWGYFWFGFVLLLISSKFVKIKKAKNIINIFKVVFGYTVFLVLIPEFFYMKDIYPSHFRANTMFKLGYQSFIISSLLFAPTLYLFKNFYRKTKYYKFLKISLVILSFFVFIYPFFSITSYYGKLIKPVELDGSLWLKTFYPQDKEVIDFLNKNVKGQPTILEAQGDSYTDYNRISVFTGLPTVAGWFVHEWLWRGSPAPLSLRIPDIVNIYESPKSQSIIPLIKKYNINYIIVSTLEREKYKNLNEEKFLKIGNLIFESSDRKAKIYKINQNLSEN